MPKAPPKRKASASANTIVEAQVGKGSGGVFSLEYAKLNPQQRLAVETIEGPVMVIAGPGTGKTQVVALRVANILQRTHMRPSNILCLTFSNSGATAMRERLRTLIGPDAYGVRVSTIHAFAQSIIEDHAFYFDDLAARTQISDIERIREMNTIIDQSLPQSSLINPKDPYARIQEILGRISEVKREGKTTMDLERCADEYDGVQAEKSKPGTKAHEKNVLQAKKFRDFVGLFKAYQEMMQRTGRYDYDDMILYVIAALQEEDWMLQGLQERYQYVLVDEFQDTNGAQYRFIELLTTYANVDNDPNLFVVGDDDQAIYRFQGANLRNMLGFHERFPKAPVIALATSYRSTQAILDAAQYLIERNEERLVGKIPSLQKILTAAAMEKGIAPKLLRAASDTAETWFIADTIEDRLKQGIPPEEIAVLTRTNDELFPLYDVLRARGIPVLLRGKDDLLSHPLVLQALTILHALEQPRNDARLSAALACDCFHLHPADMGRLHRLGRERNERLFDVLLALPTAEESAMSSMEALEDARDVLLDLHYKMPSRTALETVEHVLRDCRLIPMEAAAALDTTVDPRDLAALEAFFSYVVRTCLERRACSLTDLFADLKIYSDPTYATIRLTYELPHLTTEGVQLLTAHQSKGLEFHTVILANFRDGHWNKRSKRSGISIPEDLLYGWEKEQKSFEEGQDERRIAFVALTRAKRELLLACPYEMTVGEKARSISPSGFFAEMGMLSEEDGHLRNPEAASLLLLPKPKLIDGALRSYIEERLKTYMLSATALNRYLRNPEEFLLVDLLEQPEHFDEGSVRRLGYGSAVHWALRQWAAARKDGKDFSIEQLQEAFAWYLSERTILTEKQRDDLIGLGTEALPRYFEQRLASANPFLYSIERDYRTHMGDVPLKGKIDRIDLLSKDSGIATVIDYKAGKGKSESEIRGGMDPGKISRTEEGSHFRQLAFYAVLLEKADPLLEPREFVLEYIGERGEHPVTRSFVVTESEREDLRRLVKDVWTKITNLDFSPLN